MSVNLAAEQFQDKKLISFVNKVLCETKLDAKYLELEITESAAVDKEKYKYTIQMLNELKALGVSISIDDFGTEYSSLGRLKTLPIDQLKIDMQFVQNISESKKDEAIVKTIIQLAKNLELNVIAEGVEKEEQYEFLRKEMCDEIQGYYFYYILFIINSIVYKSNSFNKIKSFSISIFFQMQSLYLFYCTILTALYIVHYFISCDISLMQFVSENLSNSISPVKNCNCSYLQ